MGFFGSDDVTNTTVVNDDRIGSTDSIVATESAQITINDVSGDIVGDSLDLVRDTNESSLSLVDRNSDRFITELASEREGQRGFIEKLIGELRTSEEKETESFFNLGVVALVGVVAAVVLNK